LCAHNRKVKGKRIDKIFPVFTSKIVSEKGEECWLQLYITSNYLDERVNISRNEIIFPKVQEDSDENGLIEEFKSECKTVSKKNIDDFVIQELKNKYQKIIEKRKNYLRHIVKKYINSDEGLEYRTLDIDDDVLSSIPDKVDDKKLDTVLYEQQYKKRKEIKKKIERLLEKDFSKKEEYQTLFKEVASLTTQESNTKLVQYVVHRKTIIELFDKYLGWCEENGNYEEESTLHNLIFVMGGSNENIPYDSHNLWLLDDRLAFHRYIYSDKAIKKHKPQEMKTNSRLETDLAIYDVVYTYGEKTEYEEVASTVIFEFKRPGRSLTYDEFSEQMRKQVDAVNTGNVIDKNGNHIATSESTPIFYYYVCDINAYNSLKVRAIKYEAFNETPYKSLMKLFNNVYVEIMPYQTLLVNSRRRNRAFFKKLGLE
jgi:hypothetical protein